MMQVTGEEGVSQEDFVTQQKAMLVDMVYLLSSYFMGAQYWEGVKSEKEIFDQWFAAGQHNMLQPGCFDRIHDGLQRERLAARLP